MDLLTINTGSASIKLAGFRWDGATLHAAGRAGYATDRSATEIIGDFQRRQEISFDAVAHRIVHGGPSHISPQLLDGNAMESIAELDDIAPLHNPLALKWVRACQSYFGAAAPQVGVFDTAFFAELPPQASAYALPRSLSERLTIRRYGFHGIAHQAMWKRWCRLRPDLPEGGKIISLQLGGGCSAAAVAAGKPRDTSMGFTPLEGLVMGTRCGDLDAGVLTFLLRREKLSVETLEHLLNEECGLLGLSGNSADMRELLANQQHPPNAHAVDVYCYRTRKYLGAYMAVLDGVDGIVFGGGVGENSPEVRSRILSDMSWCGLELDAVANAAMKGSEGRISRPGSGIDVRVIPVDESLVIAEEAVAVLRAHGIP